jgi:coenzyme F420-dependent glucose-6-phosphate dehydrogenase
MAIISYQASHEQFPPSQLLALAKLAEEAGFTGCNSSDHFLPWSERQGQSGFSFAWLGAAMNVTKFPFSMVCAPGQRYHPAIVAQAIATLSEMFEGRFSVALASGEAMNEAITGERWPPKEERNARLLECVDIIRRMLGGETVTHRGMVKVEQAKLYTRPVTMPKLFCAAITPETAKWAGEWADGLLTVHQPMDKLKEVVKAFRDGGGKGKPMHLKVQLSYAPTEQEALDGAYDQWRTNIFDSKVLSDLSRVSQFDALGEYVKPQDMYEMVHISSDVQKHVAWLKAYIELGFDCLVLHNVNRQQELFIKDFGAKVIQQLQ